MLAVPLFATQLAVARCYIRQLRDVTFLAGKRMRVRVSKILVVNSSVSGDMSVSRSLVEHTVSALLDAGADGTVVHRDLGDGLIPHLTPATVLGIRAEAKTADELSTSALSDELIDELRAADVIVIGAPMYNFSIPSSLRAWFDHVLRPRVTFAYGENGPQGLLTGKRAIVIEPRGGVYSEGPTKAIDFQEPYLKQLLGFIGITDVSFIHAEKIGYGPEARQAALGAARAQIAGVVARITDPTDQPEPSANAKAATDYDAIMQANLARVFGERDADRRIVAIRELYAADAVLHEPEHSAQGHEAISQAVTDLLAHLPPDFTFHAIRPALGHNGVGRLQWTGGQPDAAPAVTGLDVAHIEGGMIRSLHVFIDQPGA
jgi:FMN-dependent NADH-azoreductase